MTELTIAMPKGRIFEEAYKMLIDAGFNLPEEVEMSRKLMLEIPEEKIRFILAKPMDVPVYVNMVLQILGLRVKIHCWN